MKREGREDTAGWDAGNGTPIFWHRTCCGQSFIWHPQVAPSTSLSCFDYLMEGSHTLGLNKNEPEVLGSRGGVSKVGPKRMPND